MFFLPFTSLLPAAALPPALPPIAHVHGFYICSLASPLPMLFLPSSCLFSTYHLCFLFPVPFPCLSPSHSPTDNPSPCDLHFCDSVPVLVVCLVCFVFVLGSIVDSYEFVILLFIFFIFFFLDKFL